jgi:hypothetical protein
MPDLALKIDIGFAIPLASKDFNALDTGVDVAKYILSLLVGDNGVPAENSVTDLVVRSVALSSSDGLINLDGYAPILLSSVAPVATKKAAPRKPAAKPHVRKSAYVHLPYRGLWNPNTAREGLHEFLEKFGPEIHELFAQGKPYDAISRILTRKYGDRFFFYPRHRGVNRKTPPTMSTVGGYHHMWAFMTGTLIK